MRRGGGMAASKVNMEVGIDQRTEVNFTVRFKRVQLATVYVRAYKRVRLTVQLRLKMKKYLQIKLLVNNET